MAKRRVTKSFSAKAPGFSRGEYVKNRSSRVLQPPNIWWRRSVPPRLFERATLACFWIHHVPVVQAARVALAPPGFQPGVQTAYTRPARRFGCPGRICTCSNWFRASHAAVTSRGSGGPDGICTRDLLRDRQAGTLAPLRDRGGSTRCRPSLSGFGDPTGRWTSTLKFFWTGRRAPPPRLDLGKVACCSATPRPAGIAPATTSLEGSRSAD